MNIGLIGYGKMGRLVEEVALGRGHQVVFKADIAGNEQGQALTEANLRGVEVALDFSMPGAVVQTVERISSLGVPMVVGTTGWWTELERVRRMVEDRNVGLVYGSNFSIGANLFFRLMETAATLLSGFPEYDPWIYEIHHRAKLDAPSGTALKLMQVLAKNYAGREISIASNRAGSQPGEHTVGFDSEADSLVFTHTARNRLGLASGAVRAAEWVRDKKGFYEFSEIFPV